MNEPRSLRRAPSAADIKKCYYRTDPITASISSPKLFVRIDQRTFAVRADNWCLRHSNYNRTTHRYTEIERAMRKLRRTFASSVPGACTAAADAAASGLVCAGDRNTIPCPAAAPAHWAVVLFAIEDKYSGAHAVLIAAEAVLYGAEIERGRETGGPCPEHSCHAHKARELLPRSVKGSVHRIATMALDGRYRWLVLQERRCHSKTLCSRVKKLNAISAWLFTNSTVRTKTKLVDRGSQNVVALIRSQYRTMHAALRTAIKHSID